LQPLTFYQPTCERAQKGTLIQAEPEVSQEEGVNGCVEVIARLTEGSIFGTVTYQPELDSTLEETDPPMNIMDIQCLRDDQGHFQLFVDAEIPVQRTTSLQPIKAMLTAYYQPADKQLTWYGLEVGLDESKGSGNATTPVTVPATSIVLEQTLTP
jgi:hypothetical protein